MMKQERTYWIIGGLSLFLALFLALVLVIGLTQCGKGDGGRGDIAYYTCPMHPQIHMDKPGQCPICGMDLVPVKKDDASTSGHGPREGEPPGGFADLEGATRAPTIEIDPRYTQRIGVTTEAVARRALSRTVRASGKVAHDPELWVAQNEYVQALALGDASLIRASELKLQFLGLSPEWIKSLKEEKKVQSSFHLPEHLSEYIEAYVYPMEADDVKSGDVADIYSEGGQKIRTGTVASVASILDRDTRTLRVLIHVKEGIPLKPNAFIQVGIHVPLGDVLAVPKSAILFNGDRTIVYVMTEDGRYSPRKIVLGKSGDDYDEVKDGLQEGDKVVTNGHFLIDSETQIRLGATEHHHD